jgi:hypothetical protein
VKWSGPPDLHCPWTVGRRWYGSSYGKSRRCWGKFQRVSGTVQRLSSGEGS